MGHSMGLVGALLPLIGIVALMITAARRRREKNKRFKGTDGRT